MGASELWGWPGKYAGGGVTKPVMDEQSLVSFGSLIKTHTVFKKVSQINIKY